MPTKKYVLFIVEGKNDQIEIQAMLRAYCANSLQDKYVDIYLPYNGDITFDETEKTITGKLTEAVLSWRRGETRLHPYHPVSPSDVARIVHVIDTDGAYIPEEAIIADDVGDVEYNVVSDVGIEPLSLAETGRRRKQSKSSYLFPESIISHIKCSLCHATWIMYSLGLETLRKSRKDLMPDILHHTANVPTI